METDRSPAHIDSDPNVENSYSKQASEPINNTPTVEASPGADYELALINQQTDTEREQDLQTEHLREPERKLQVVMLLLLLKLLQYQYLHNNLMRS